MYFGRAVEHFHDAVGGCLRALADDGFTIPPVNMTVMSDVPVGKGLSSSAALEVATLRALNQAFSLQLSDIAIANLAWNAETRYAGVNCGIMDQMASAMGRDGAAMFLDTRSLEIEYAKIPDDLSIVICDTKKPRALTDSAYNERRSQCEQAATILGVPQLRDSSISNL